MSKKGGYILHKHMIALETLVPNGGIEAQIMDSTLHMTTTRAIHDIGYNIYRDKITSYMSIPGQYRLPMQIDLTVKVDSPEMLLLVGKGHVSIGSPWMENRRIEDIAEPLGKPRQFDNGIHYNEYTDIRVIFNLNEMQILINNEERYFSSKERYMKSRYFHEQNAAGLGIGITCTKRAQLSIQSISITEYEGHSPFVHEMSASKEKPLTKVQVQPRKPTFESCIAGLPTEIKNEIQITDSFRKTLKQLKFKRTLEKHGNKITYVSPDNGVSYAMYLSGNVMHHSIQWYLVSNCKPELWHRKANALEETLEEVRRSSPGLAGRIFANLNECIGCRSQCLAKTTYYYQAQMKQTCHGNIFFKMHIPDFQDARDFLAALNTLLEKSV